MREESLLLDSTTEPEIFELESFSPENVFDKYEIGVEIPSLLGQDFLVIISGEFNCTNP
jgi:hypothetical protein